jgi:hypothetical protein
VRTLDSTGTSQIRREPTLLSCVLLGVSGGVAEARALVGTDGVVSACFGAAAVDA